MPSNLTNRLHRAHTEAKRIRNSIQGKTAKNINNNARKRRINGTKRNRNASPARPRFLNRVAAAAKKH